MGALVGGLQCMLVPTACVSVLLAVRVSLLMICVLENNKVKKKSEKKFNGGGEMVVVYMVFFAESSLPGTRRCDVISHAI